MWRQTKATAKMKPDTELTAQSVRASEWNSVVVGSNLTQVNFLFFIYNIYIYILYIYIYIYINANFKL